jgi:pimeloyl-ACP methyl ester carboxylesterase
LCPQGKRLHAKDPAQGYYYPDHLALQREVLGAIERFETLVVPPDATRPYVYAGYSQGATMGALAFAQHGGLFAELVLVEGGFADWSQALVNQFRESGGKAVLFVCGTKHCATQAAGAVHRFTKSGLKAKLARASGAGHVPNGAVGQALSSSLGFVLEGDPRWQGFTPNPEDYSAPGGE